jgi:extracellular factor (EF) 3-hydroxypalmitic acid methyl ester biosynthesis protein
MEPLPNRDSINLAYSLKDALDAYFDRLGSVACVSIVDELVRSLAQFYDAAAASNRLAEFRAGCQDHPLHRLLLEDPFTERAFERSSGHGPDPVMLDYVYRPRHIHLSEVGDAVHFVTTGVGVAQAIALRRDYLAKAIAQAVRSKRKARILSVASGHLRELDVVRRMVDRRDFQIIALDWDRVALQEAVNANPEFNITPLEQPVSRLIGAQNTAKYDLIYSAGLFDDLETALASSLLARLVDMLAPGGRLITANSAPDHYGRGYMEGMMDWRVNYRSTAELARLSARSRKLGRYKIYRGAPGSLLYLEVTSASN